MNSILKSDDIEYLVRYSVHKILSAKSISRLQERMPRSRFRWKEFPEWLPTGRPLFRLLDPNDKADAGRRQRLSGRAGSKLPVASSILATVPTRIGITTWLKSDALGQGSAERGQQPFNLTQVQPRLHLCAVLAGV